uniref:C2H2-type domain-containing protein n=1 Tax=Rhodosorus marinus TaxID=101924 RepID=A0A7S0BPV1_9RHOD|mmetsp:Transcript_3123/g.4477  ORF Transcript_3123/g.4477 Transcript_3123/m.4477 type:complete len:166 (+) Transcript_3123:127-624(+)
MMPRKTFRCETCGKEFSRKFNKKMHKRTHTDEKPYQCWCGEGFRWKQQLVQHSSKHLAVVDPRVPGAPQGTICPSSVQYTSRRYSSADWLSSASSSGGLSSVELVSGGFGELNSGDLSSEGLCSGELGSRKCVSTGSSTFVPSRDPDLESALDSLLLLARSPKKG